MSWIKLDDKLHRHPKARESSDAAFKVWVLSWSYCGDMPTPTGYLSTKEAAGFVRGLGKPLSVVKELVERRMWDEVDGGFVVHEFEQGLPGKSTERVRAWREKKKQERLRASPETVTQLLQSVPPHARAVPVPDPVPVPGNASKEATPVVRDRLKDAIQNGKTEDLALQLARRVSDDVMKRSLSPLEVAWCDQVLQEFAYLGVDDVVERMRSQLEWGKQQKVPSPTSTAWFTQSLRVENDHRADQGQPKAWRPPPVHLPT